MTFLLVLLLVAVLLLGGYVAVAILPAFVLVVKLALLALGACVAWIGWLVYTEHRRGKAWNDLTQEQRDEWSRRQRTAHLRATQAAVDARRERIGSIPPQDFIP